MKNDKAENSRSYEELLAENRELRLQLQQALEASAAKETFLSNMSHDIRTPMNAIVGMTALAKRYIDEKSRVMDALDKIETAGGHLLNLINDMLDMSRINSGRLKLTSEAFSLSDLIHDILIIIRPQMESRKHDFRLHLEHIEAESFLGDPLRIRQILVNILSNAAKYTEDGGRVEFTVSEEAGPERCLLDFTCRDNGIGMSKEFLERIFEPFERVNSSTISRIEGTGLGMSIVRRLVDAMEGEIHIDSTPGEGTEVRIRLPLKVEKIQAETGALRGKRLLVVEQDEKRREIYAKYLGEFNLEHTVVSAMPEALSALTEADFRQQPYHLVLIGGMKEGSARMLDLAAYLHESWPGVTLVLISEDDWPRIEYRANRAGVRHFIPVPVFRKTLVNGLNAALEGEADESSSAGSPNLEGKRILLVEDNAINREIAVEVLKMTNAAVDTAENGRRRGPDDPFLRPGGRGRDPDLRHDSQYLRGGCGQGPGSGNERAYRETAGYRNPDACPAERAELTHNPGERRWSSGSIPGAVPCQHTENCGAFRSVSGQRSWLRGYGPGIPGGGSPDCGAAAGQYPAAE